MEAICQKITGNSNATLRQALDFITAQKQIEIPEPLKQAFERIYGYASSHEGIRHALQSEPNITQDEARFMLISCSAFVNYLISKSASAGIEFD